MAGETDTDGDPRLRAEHDGLAGNAGRIVLVETEEERGEIETEDSEDVTARIVTLAVGGLFSLILSNIDSIRGSVASTPGNSFKTSFTKFASCTASVSALVGTNLQGAIRRRPSEPLSSSPPDRLCAPSNTNVCLLLAAHSENTKDRRKGEEVENSLEGVLGG